MIYAQIIVYASFVYLGLGALFAVWFVTLGIARFDESARGAGIGFRIMVLFGATAFWVLLAWRIATGRTAPEERTAHRAKPKQ